MKDILIARDLYLVLGRCEPDNVRDDDWMTLD